MADWEVVRVHKKKKNSNASDKNKQQLFHDNVIQKYCVRLCRKPKQDHDTALCMQAHNENDLRRCPFLAGSSNSVIYSVNPCTDFPACSKGKACSHAHTRNEVLYHPMIYKTKLCKRKQCDFYYCAFAHGDSDRRSPAGYEIVQRERSISLTEYIPSVHEEGSKEEIIEIIRDWTGWQTRFGSTVLLPCPLEDVYSRMLCKYDDVRMKIREICLSKTCTPFLNTTNRSAESPTMLLIQGRSNDEIYEAMESIESYLQECRPKLDDVFPPRFTRYLQNAQEGAKKLKDFCKKYRGIDISIDLRTSKVVVWGGIKKIRQDILYDLKMLSTKFALDDAKLIADAKLQSLEYELENTRKQLQEALRRQTTLVESLRSSESIISNMNSKLKLPKHEKHIVPEEWETTTGYHECLVPMNSVEWDKVYSSFVATIQEESGIRYLPRVLKILRIENHALWKHYHLMKEEIHNEMKLWHGTAYDNLNPICKQGFNRSYAGQHATAFGEGTYFAKNSGYSYRYASRDSSIMASRYMIQATVLIGTFLKGYKGMKEPKQNDIRFNSAVNTMDRPTIFVVFKDYQAYPAYVIKFTS